ncbi:dicarboxylate/amino acid:cation symporter [Larsenimonas suaedae]|uniref:Dicarboxylate/amino acid:cation symporter n=1 Tax=Larsenimonas suaedae TaxID=1851019 RepID=A0ABU1GWX7_9GAMM|nr:dicarboxylate/amino acid:cation symporter [Larsenimonas suaedae]MCM2973062.1 dicarboxylate/amino acid:cation symporter [Larsenimonas suaedae]MDR5896499.1 dicarboxylate/amino acid:cation symporter [Larsenimonas suaedae]
MAVRLLKNTGLQVVIAMIIGVLTGIALGKDASMFAPLGDLFIHLITMLVVPLIAVAIISGAAGLGNSSSAGRMGALTLGFFLTSSAIAVGLALLLGELLHPGVGVDLSQSLSNEYADKGNVPGFWDTLLGMVPTNIFAALSQANILQILVFCMFFGLALTRVDKTRVAPLLDGLQTVMDAFIWMIKVVMYLAPIGVFGLMADAVGTFGFGVLESVSRLVGVYFVGLLIFGLVVYPLIVRFCSDLSLKVFFSRMKKPQVVALSTASSMATLPINMEVAEKELGLSNETCSFVLPLGATINMAGNAIYYGLAAVFFAQVFGVDLSLGAYGAIIFTATIGAIGQAGVPGPSFLVVAVLIAAGIPTEGLPLLIALDRIFDMTRTALNVTGDVVGAAVVDKWGRKNA